MDSDNMFNCSLGDRKYTFLWMSKFGASTFVYMCEWDISSGCVPVFQTRLKQGSSVDARAKSGGAGCKDSISAYLLRQSVNSVSTFELWTDDHLTASADAREEGWHRSQELTPRSPQRSMRTSSRRWGWDSSWGKQRWPPRRWWPSPRRAATGRWSPRPLSRVSSLSSGEYIRFRAISQTPDEFEEGIRISV